MKFSSLLATTSLLVSVADGASLAPILREDEDDHGMESLYRLKIGMHGLLGQPTESDLQVVSDALIKAFNQAQADQGGEYLMSNFAATSFNLIPEDDAAGFIGLKDGHEGFGLIYGWAHAPSQRSQGMIYGENVGESMSPFAVMTAVEDLLCKFVAEAGGPVFSNVHSCSFYPMKQDSKAILHDLMRKDGKRGDSSSYNLEITIPGLEDDGSKDRKRDWFSIFGDNLIAAYNEVHKGDDNVMYDFVATGFDEEDDDPNNLRSVLQGRRGTLKGWSKEGCSYCRRSSDNTVALSRVPFDKVDKVEKVFCEYVSNTKSKGLDKVHGCKIKVVDNNVKGDENVAPF